MSGSMLDDLAPNLGQKIDLNDGRPSSINGIDVFVHQSEQSKLGLESSGLIRINTLVGQSWQPSEYGGNMIASSKDYLAYVLQSRSGYVVRIIQLKTKDRALLKKFSGKICDLSFLRFNSNILAVLDQAGNIHVYDLDIAQGDVSKIGDSSKIKIMSNTVPDKDLHKLVWCPIVHNDDEASANETLILAASNGRTAEVYEVNEVAQEYRIGMVHDKKKLAIGRAFIEDAHEGDICDIALAPDGNVLATAGTDGHVKFWEIDVDNIDNKPTCVHDYEPHGGKPVTRILFCDNHLTHDPTNKFWRFMLTASNDNTVIKVWCTVKWKCLQTITFLPPSTGEYPSSKMIMMFDLTASYLILADTTSMVLYVLPLYQEPDLGDASFISITEYVLTQSLLSFVISGCNPVRFTPVDSSEDEEDEDNDEEAGPRQVLFNPKRTAVMIHLYCIQTRSLQELRVRFEPPGMMGIPPPPTTVDEEPNQSHEDKPSADQTSTGPDTPPPLVQSEDQSTDPLQSTHSLNPLSLPQSLSSYASGQSYAPGQSSPSVMLLSPDNILSHTNSSPTGSSATPSASSHVLYSPSDFNARSVSKHQTTTTVKSNVESSLNDSLSSQIVTIPLQKINDNDENNEEMVMAASPPGGSLTLDNNNEIKSFPSAHNISGSTLEPSNETRNMNESIDDVESWPDLSAEESERKSESETIDPDNNETASQECGSTSQEDTKRDGQDIATITPPCLTPPNEEESDTLTEEQDTHISESPSFLEEAKEAAANVVTSAINAAVYITENKLKNNNNNEAEAGDEEGTLDETTQDQVIPPDQSMKEEEEMSDDEVRSKPLTTSDPSVPSEVTSSDTTLDMDSTTVLLDQQPIASSTVRDIANDNSTLQLLVEMVQQQQAEIHALKAHTQQSIEGLQSLFRDSFEEFTKGQQSSFSNQLQEHYQRTEKLVKDKPTLEPKRVTQSLTHAVNTAVNAAVTAQVERCVKNEFKRTVTPAVQRQLIGMQEQTLQTVQQTLHQKLSVIDVTVKETLERAINFQGIIDSVGGSVASSLHHIVQKNSEAVFLTAVLPSFQNALKEIFNQINVTFQQGMAEYFSQLQMHEATVQENALRTLHTSLLAPNSPLTQLINATLSQELSSVTQKLETSLSGSISSVVRSGIEESLSNTNLATGPSMKQQKDRIQALLNDKAYDAAFNLALSTSNLEVVTETCQMINPDEVFDANSDSTLTQPVLLSLIQQLAVGLQDQIELKMKYLEMAILSLDPEDPITSPHLPPVMQLLHEQIVKVEDQLHASKGGSPALFRGAKRVRMLASHVKKSTQKS